MLHIAPSRSLCYLSFNPSCSDQDAFTCFHSQGILDSVLLCYTILLVYISIVAHSLLQEFIYWTSQGLHRKQKVHSEEIIKIILWRGHLQKWAEVRKWIIGYRSSVSVRTWEEGVGIVEEQPEWPCQNNASHLLNSTRSHRAPGCLKDVVHRDWILRGTEKHREWIWGRGWQTKANQHTCSSPH